jgi:CheY-like chemotaxis protein
MGAKILIVEDDRDIRKNLKRLLEMEGYGVDVAENGQIALDLLQASLELPSLILLDLMMPVMDGFQFRELQQKSARLVLIPVIIMTAGGNVEEKKIATGAQGALRKPADVEAILEMVKKFTS